MANTHRLQYLKIYCAGDTVSLISYMGPTHYCCANLKSCHLKDWDPLTFSNRCPNPTSSYIDAGVGLQPASEAGQPKLTRFVPCDVTLQLDNST